MYLLQLSFELTDEISVNLKAILHIFLKFLEYNKFKGFFLSFCVTSFLSGITSIRTGPPMFYRENCQLLGEDTYLREIQNRCASGLWIFDVSR